MILIRHERTPVDDQPVENTFCAIDAGTGKTLATSVVYTDLNPALYPARPLQVRLQFDGNPLPDKLIGATIARAHMICEESETPARIFTRCAPEDRRLMDALEPFGFEDTDGLVRMRCALPNDYDVKPPAGCAVVYDDLSDALERRYFLERYNQLFNIDHDMKWLARFIDRNDFARILTVASTGMVGEVLVWREDQTGVIGYIQTSRRWRRLGVATYMLTLAFDALDQLRLSCVETNVRVRYPYMLKLLEKVGFEQSELLMRYPGIDINK